MFPEERHQHIVDQLERTGRVTVTDLAQRFGVTEDCIRKDLKQLAADGRCKRVYGGATKAEASGERLVANRLAKFKPEKQEIARKALALIEPKQVIYLDISSTNLYLAQLIAASGTTCTVVSPMIDINQALAASASVTAICPGGAMHSELNGFVGSVAIEAVRRFRFELAFIGAAGIDVDEGQATTYDAEDGLLKRTAIECSGRSYLMCESRKLNAYGNFRFAGFSDFEALICDDDNAEACGLVRKAELEVL